MSAQLFPSPSLSVPHPTLPPCQVCEKDEGIAVFEYSHNGYQQAICCAQCYWKLFIQMTPGHRGKDVSTHLQNTHR